MLEIPDGWVPKLSTIGGLCVEAKDNDLQNFTIRGCVVFMEGNENGQRRLNHDGFLREEANFEKKHKKMITTCMENRTQQRMSKIQGD